MPVQLSKSLVAILFYRAEPVPLSDLAKLLDVSLEIINTELSALPQALEPLGLALVVSDDKAELRTSAESSVLIEAIRKEELSRDLGKAGLETLAILLYKGPSTRAEVEYVRGVNSSAILRNLLIRGLVERIANPKDQRSFLYKPTIDTLSELGIGAVRDLPDYERIQAELTSFEMEEQTTTST